MTPIPKLADLLAIPALDPYRDDVKSWFGERDTIKRIIAARIAEAPVDHWLSILEPADIWCAKVLDWEELMASEGFAHARHAADGDPRGQCLDPDHGLAAQGRRQPLP